MTILSQQLPEQILPDGGHFERSPMYHALVLEDMLDLVNLERKFPIPFSEWQIFVDSWQEVVIRMTRWLRVMQHPDGEISFFNDSAIGIAATPRDIFTYAGRLGIGISGLSAARITMLRESGYLRIDWRNLVLILDAAPVGPDYLPGHAHADTLSFELSFAGQRVFVNSGTSCYGNSVERIRQRDTAAHNTVVINDQNSSEVWGVFRVARRARPKIDKIQDEGERVFIAASHDGYSHLKGGDIHIRNWVVSSDAVILEDEIIGPFDRAEARFHLHPDVAIYKEFADERRVILQLPNGGIANFCVEGGLLRIESSTWHPEFGKSVGSACIVVTFTQTKISSRISWPNIS